MVRSLLLGLSLIAQPAMAEELPQAIACYQESTNARDIDAYMACFAADAEMIDVSRRFSGNGSIRAWAEREVITHGDTFRHRRTLDAAPGYAKTEVNWLTWVVHYSYWWDDTGKITRMSLQYAD